MILALLNNKGGVAKTTTAVNVAAALATLTPRVLLVDLDSQGSAGLSLGIPREGLSPSIADALLDNTPIASLIRPTSVDGLDIVTGSIDLADTDVALYDNPERLYRLQTALEPIRKNYSYIIIDCPPSLSLLPLNALLASDAYIVPITPQYLAVEGLINLTAAVNKLSQGTGKQLALMGLVLTMVDYRTKATREVIEQIRQHYRSTVFTTEIRVNVRLSESPSFGQTIFQYDPSSTGAAAYKNLAGEIIERSKSVKK